MPLGEQEIRAMLLGRDRELGGRLVDAARLDADLESAGGAVIGLDLPCQGHARLLAEAADLVEQLVPHRIFAQDALHVAGAVAQHQEVQLALGGPVVNPATQGDGLTGVLAEAFDRGNGGGHGGP